MADRAETGPMRFGDDWAGVFVRGDNAAGCVLAVRELRRSLKQLPAELQLAIGSLFRVFDGGHIEGSGRHAAAQQLKSFAQCAGQVVRWVDAAPEGVSPSTRFYFGLHNPAVSTVVEMYHGGLVRLLQGPKHCAVIQLQQLGLDVKEGE